MYGKLVCVNVLPEAGDLGIEATADPGDLRFRDPRIDTQRGNEVIDIAVGHTVHVGLHDHRGQRLIDPRRRSSRLGKKDPDRSFGICTSTSPLMVATVFGRVPLR